MPLSTFVDSFSVLAADAVGTTYVRTGYGFQPKSGLVWTCGRNSAGVDSVGGGNYRYNIGCFVSTTSRRALGGHSEDGAAAGDCDHIKRTTECVLTQVAGGTVDGALDISAIGSDGMTFIVDDQFGADIRVFVWAHGGSDITNTEIGTFQNILVTGQQTVTLAGAFQPDVVFFLPSRTTAVTSQADAKVNIGFGLTATKMGMLCIESEDGATTSDTFRHCSSDLCLSFWNGAPSTTNAFGGFAEYDGPVSTGFIVNWLAAEGTARDIYYLAIKGGRWDSGSLQTRTDGNDIVVSGLAFQPTGILFLSHGNPETTGNDTADANCIASIGAASSITNRACAAISDQDGLADMEVATALEFDEVYIHMNLADNFDGLMDLKSVESTGFTCVMDDFDPSANFVLWIAAGSAAAAADELLQSRRMISVP